MSFIARELDRIREKLLELKSGEKYDQLYAAQQALAWALDPEAANSPYKTIMRGTQEGPEDCPASIHPVVS